MIAGRGSITVKLVRRKGEGETSSTCKYLAWFSRLTVAGALERGSLTATWVSNIRNVALFVHPSSFMPSVLLICCYLCSSYFDSRPHDDVNARRHNDESRRLRSRIACGGNGSGLRYLPNRMKKRTHQAPHQGNERTSQDRSPSARKAAFRSLPSSSLASIVSSLSRLLVEGNAEPLIEEGKKKTCCCAVHRNAPNKYRSFTNRPRLIAPPYQSV